MFGKSNSSDVLKPENSARSRHYFNLALYAAILPVTVLSAGRSEAAAYSRVICDAEAASQMPISVVAQRHRIVHRVHRDGPVAVKGPSPAHAVPVRKHAAVRSAQASTTVCHSIPVRPIGGTYGGIRGFGYFFSANGNLSAAHFGGSASYPGSPEAGGGPGTFGGAPGLVSGGYSPIPGNTSDTPLASGAPTQVPTSLSAPSPPSTSGPPIGTETKTPPPQIAGMPSFPSSPIVIPDQPPNQQIIDMPPSGTPPLELPPGPDVPDVPVMVPEPSALWVFLTALGGTFCLRSKRRI